MARTRDAKRAALGGPGAVAPHFRPVRGQVCWGVHYSRLLNLSLNFGAPHLSIREPRKSRSRSREVRRALARRVATPRGRWWLWVYLARWSLSCGDVTVTNSSSLRKISDALVYLSGQKLMGAEVDPHTGATRLTFDLGAKLEVRRWGTEPEELWLLYEPNGHVLSVWGDGTYRHGPGFEA